MDPILIIDDEKDNLEALNRLLRSQYNVTTVDSPLEGLKLLQKNEYNVIISDQRMPEISGVELLEKSWGASKSLACIDLYADQVSYSSVYYDDFSLEGGPGEDPDLQCSGSLRWENISASSALEGSFKVRNIGGSGSLLDWEITNTPSWGEWTFMPSSGDDLTPEEENITVEVDVIAPPEQNEEFNGKVRIENKENPDDYCEILVYISTPRSKTLYETLFMRVLEKFPNAFPILRNMLGL